jgi:hypothetical protein
MAAAISQWNLFSRLRYFNRVPKMSRPKNSQINLNTYVVYGRVMYSTCPDEVQKDTGKGEMHFPPIILRDTT